jgi:SAM-dependent methyltransferase
MNSKKIKMNINCKICKGSARLIYNGFPGYIEDSFFDIAKCDVCDVAFSTKSNNLGFIYDSIYTHASKLQGYSRYAFYARQVLRERDPLSFLGECEECYWAVAQLVNDWVQRNGRRPKILEIGCGYGYTTYALRKRGFDATGMDISFKAVQKARERYGNYFQCCDVLELANASTDICDIIVMTELIEHIEDPPAFLAQIAKLLRLKGIIVVTTPNKAGASKDEIWETELPPVHLWWFTEASLR